MFKRTSGKTFYSVVMYTKLNVFRVSTNFAHSTQTDYHQKSSPSIRYHHGDPRLDNRVHRTPRCGDAQATSQWSAFRCVRVGCEPPPLQLTNTHGTAHTPPDWTTSYAPTLSCTVITSTNSSSSFADSSLLFLNAAYGFFVSPSRYRL